MKVVIELDLNDNEDEYMYKLYQQAFEMCDALHAISHELRRITKYGSSEYPTELEEASIDKFREKFYEILDEKKVTILEM